MKLRATIQEVGKHTDLLGLETNYGPFGKLVEHAFPIVGEQVVLDPKKNELYALASVHANLEFGMEGKKWRVIEVHGIA